MPVVNCLWCNEEFKVNKAPVGDRRTLPYHRECRKKYNALVDQVHLEVMQSIVDRMRKRARA